MTQDALSVSRMHRTIAFCIHIFTASGAAWAFLAMMAAAQKDWPGMFLWLGVALFVDGVDGPLARKFRLPEVLPEWSGEILDLVVDFITYVFVPAYAIVVSGVLPDQVGLLAGAAIVVTSALYFADLRMKMEGNYFRGFPAIWNVAAFYLLLFMPAPWLAAALVGALVVMTFLPIPFIHPVRVVHMRRLNLTLLAVWLVLAAIAVRDGLDPATWVNWTLGVMGLYILCGGVIQSSLKVRKA